MFHGKSWLGKAYALAYARYKLYSNIVDVAMAVAMPP